MPEKPLPGIKTIIRFGSRAKGEETADSDHDVLVFADEEQNLLHVAELVSQLLPYGDLDIRLYTPHLAPDFAFSVLRDAEILYEAEVGQGVLSLAELARIAEPPPLPLRDFLEVQRMSRTEALEKLERKLSALESRMLGLTAVLQGVSQEDFLADEVLPDFTFARLYKIVQGAIDLAALWIALEGRVPPARGAERFEMLGRMGLIPLELASRLGAMARFRNIMAHVYDEIDNVRLYRFATKDIRDIEVFAEALKTYLVSELI